MTPRSSGSADEELPVHARSACPAGLVSSYTTSTTRIRSYRGERRLRRLQRAIPLAARNVNAAAHLGGFRPNTALVTLTYRPGVAWEPRHVTQCQEAISEYLRRRGLTFRGIWVLELTKAGIPHYHLIIWLPKGLTLPKPDKRGWWKHGLTRIEWARNATGYLVKYASKGSGGLKFPHGARLFGVRGLGIFTAHYRHCMRPFWLQEVVSQSQRIQRRPGGFYVDRDTGETWRSPWQIVARCPKWSWVEFAPRVSSFTLAEGQAVSIV